MLYNLDWLNTGRSFPPLVEQPRIERYVQNARLFDNEHFASPLFRHRSGVHVDSVGMYENCCNRISQVVGNFKDIISVPVLLNYHRFISLKMADLVAGEYPTITGTTDEENAKIKWIRDYTMFDERLYSSVIDISRFGDVPIRFYKDEETGFYNFTIWEACGWYPIVKQDGTDRITHHCLCWLENKQPDITEQDDWYLHVQIHPVENPGTYEYRVYHNMGDRNTIGRLESQTTVQTGLDVCDVFHVRSFAVSGTVYGYDDYVPIDSILSEIITRVSQISVILDKHADPSMVGPPTMLKKNQITGEFYLQHSKFYPVTDDDQQPEYLTWDGQLNAAFQQLEFLINQLYILSEMGAALTGGVDGSGNVVTGAAMRFKMVNPLAKARRVSNSLTYAVKRIFSVIGSNMPDVDTETGEPGSGEDTPLPLSHISVYWEDGLPDDPREQIENCKLATGETRMIPLEDGLMTYFKKSAEEAKALAEKVRESTPLTDAALGPSATSTAQNPNKPGPQDGTGVNPQKKGGKTSNFQARNNMKSEDK